MRQRNDPVHDLLILIADAEDTAVTELLPLYDVVDPEALAMLLTKETDHEPRIRVEFTYLQYRVMIDESGEITVRPEGPDE